ncbi:MAG: hypothetical protein J0H98_05550 [Solirubrobacterales bacterium]|nr:hypothetical protein [Solirubrobacterales bacterium]
MSKLINNPVRRYDFVQKLEWFLIAAVTMILIIRTQLWLTNYPQLGGSGLHIAHLLWGGLFMVISIWFGLIYLNRWSRTVLAILGGIGFGFFIDELGKFITSDNNYFFKPAAGIIYLIFIVMFLVIRELSRRQELNPRTALANALALLPGIAIGEFRQEEAERAGRLLDQADPDDPIVGQARSILHEATIAPSREPSRLDRTAERFRAWIGRLTTRPHFESAVIWVVILWALSSLLSVLAIDLDVGGIQDEQGPNVDSGVIGSLESISTLASIGFVAYGAWAMALGRHAVAYRNFGRALLVSILVTRVFVFIESQFAAVFGLGLDLILFAAISILASRDEQREFRFGGLGEADLAESADSRREP